MTLAPARPRARESTLTHADPSAFEQLLALNLWQSPWLAFPLLA